MPPRTEVLLGESLDGCTENVVDESIAREGRIGTEGPLAWKQMDHEDESIAVVVVNHSTFRVIRMARM